MESGESMVSKRFAAIVASAFAVLALSGCDNRRCIQSHTEWVWVNETQCYPSSKGSICTTGMVLKPMWVCDRYEEATE